MVGAMTVGRRGLGLWLGAALLALALLFITLLDQGQTFSLVQGDTAYAQQVIHEFLHDARHAAAAPCH